MATQTKQTHTPGPWSVYGNSPLAINPYVFALLDGTSIGDCAPGSPLIGKAEAEANTRLCAAAPDLLEACELQAAWFDFCIKETITVRDEEAFRAKWKVPENVHSDNWVREVRRSAIAKATTTKGPPCPPPAPK